mmetsp:Transcript_9876/g.16461  ORF Transcript_9876/g.16461 Transcript_9876/m.16461 type:complete len:100 (-) Transcript_9876:316-615(-)
MNWALPAVQRVMASRQRNRPQSGNAFAARSDQSEGSPSKFTNMAATLSSRTLQFHEVCAKIVKRGFAVVTQPQLTFLHDHKMPQGAPANCTKNSIVLRF